MKKNLMISIWFTLATTVLLGIIYPLVVTGLAQLMFPKQANGELITQEWQADWLALDRPALHRAGIFLLASFGGRARPATIRPRPADRTSVPRTRC